MNNNIEKFNDFYTKTSKELNKTINSYNDYLSKKNEYLKDNLSLFANLNSDGKLVRGILISLGYKLAGKSNIDYSYNLSLAYEIFQTAVLIHDDIINEASKRRGKDTIHTTIYDKNKKYNDKDAKKLGESIGIGMGDYGFYEANKVIINNYKDDLNFANILNYYNDVVIKTVEGELIDVELPFTSKYRLKDINLEDNIMLIYKLKTAYYTIIGPLTLGLILGGITDERLKDIESFGEKIGIAFQIQDDILGIYNDLGKDRGSDIKEFKQTILFSETIKNEKYKNELLKYYGKPDITEEEIEKVKEIFKNSGAYDYANNMMNKLYDESISEINKIDWIKKEDKKIINGFVEYLRNRKK